MEHKMNDKIIELERLIVGTIPDIETKTPVNDLLKVVSIEASAGIILKEAYDIIFINKPFESLYIEKIQQTSAHNMNTGIPILDKFCQYIFHHIQEKVDQLLNHVISNYLTNHVNEVRNDKLYLECLNVVTAQYYQDVIQRIERYLT